MTVSLAPVARVGQFLDNTINWLSALPPNPFTDLVAGALMLVRRSLPQAPDYGSTQIVIPELDTSGSTLAIKVDKTQVSADGIRLNVSAKPTVFTLPGLASSYTVLANKPALVDITTSGNHLLITPKSAGFLGLSIKSNDGTAARYLGLYIGEQNGGVIPDTTTVGGKPPLGTISVATAAGDAFLEKFNFRTGVAPIDYLYIYDQGGADYTDDNVSKLLTQAVRHGMVPVVVFYNIQAVLKGTGSASTPTGLVEGFDAAYQAINNFNASTSKQTDPTMFNGYMTRYFQKMGKDFALMNSVGVPVQVVVEPDFLGYMATQIPTYTTPTPFVATDRSLNPALVADPMIAAGLISATDPRPDDTVTGMVTAINKYVAENMPNLRLGWKTNIWSVSDQKNNSLGLLHVTDTSCTKDSCTYPWQYGWVKPVGWDEGIVYIDGQAAQLGAFLKKVGVTSWSGSSARTPFLSIDKYGVDGGYTYDPTMLSKDSQSAAFGDLGFLVFAAYTNKDPNGQFRFSDADVQKYFGLATGADFKAFYEKYAASPLGYDKTATDVQTVFTTLQNAAKTDPNLAKWFLNADHWNNYLRLVKGLSTALGGTKVMLWQIPQGHINGSTAGRDLTNTDSYYEDSATTYFFGDTFTPAGQYAAGRFTLFSANQAGDPDVSSSGNTITWKEHMTDAGDAGALSVLFGAGLGLSTRGSPTPAGDVTDQNFWFDKATGYLTGVS